MAEEAKEIKKAVEVKDKPQEEIGEREEQVAESVEMLKKEEELQKK